MTSLAAEWTEQARWRARARFPDYDAFDRLVESEFASRERMAAEEAQALRAVLEFAVAEVPYYRELFARLGLTPRDIRDRRDLPRLPILGRIALREQYEQLKPERLPRGVEVAGVVRSSGSTGPATQVVSSKEHNLMFSILTQRHMRWYRRDPGGSLAYIRLPGSFPQPRPGEWLGLGETMRWPAWRYLGTFFETGPSLAFSVLNPEIEQVAWLRRERPDYLLTRPHTLAHLAMAVPGERPCASLRGITTVSEGITPEMRRHLESIYGAPVRQGYGLNEIGLVAGICEAGRYHVHREHCLVEIVNESGEPCRDGEAGRLLVTGLRNFAMPLIRYDANDLVTALEGPCPCGRTLPSFGEVHGRFSRLKPLPPGTLERVATLRRAVLQMPLELGREVRRYQVHQLRDGSFELRVVVAGPLPSGFGERVRAAWAGAANPPLRLREVAEISLSTAMDKFDDFVSEFYDPIGVSEKTGQ